MPKLRSLKTMEGREMAGARALWHATGTKVEDFGKPVICVVNSYTQFVPGHVHLKDVGQVVARAIEAAGGVAKEMNTIAVDDGIAMGHDGMLYSLPSRDLIADATEYMANAHRADALVCISNCDKVTPGMLMAAMRLNIPAIFVSGGPMEAGHVTTKDGKDRALDLIDAMIDSADNTISDEEVADIEANACPTCGSCSGMFTANSMNSLTEALGLSLPGNGTIVATHAERKKLFEAAGKRIVELCHQYYDLNDESILPRSIATKDAFENAMRLLRFERRQHPPAQHRHEGRLRKRHAPRHRHGRFLQHRAPLARRGPGSGRRLHHEGHRPPFPQHAVHLQGCPDRSQHPR